MTTQGKSSKRSTSQARRRSSDRKSTSGEVKLGIRQEDGSVRIVTGRLVDLSDFGCGVDTDRPLPVGTGVSVASRFFEDAPQLTQRNAQVVHSRLCEGSVYRSGLAFEANDRGKRESDPPKLDERFTDFYELLQVSPSADSETIQRVYRMLAQRYHPDNGASGNEKAFRLVLTAYKVLSDPEKRAAYDAKHKTQHSMRWRIFSQPNVALGVEEEKRTRLGILSALYTLRRTQPEKPGMLVREVESLLGCPREHLEFSFWYLQAKGHVNGSDGGRYIITPTGVDAIEESGQDLARPSLRLLEGGNAS